MGMAVTRIRRAALDPRSWIFAVGLLGAYVVPFLVTPGGNGPLEFLSTAVMLPYYVSLATPFLLIGGAVAFWAGFVLYCFLLAVGAVALTDWLRLRVRGSQTESR